MTSSNSQYDTLWHSFKAGDRAAFASIYRKYVTALLNYGNKITSDRTLVEDSIQDLFFELWESRERIAETTSVKFYLFKALRYKIYHNTNTKDFSSLESTEYNTELNQNYFSYPSHESQLIGIEVQSLQMENLKTLLEQLPKRQKEAINLRYYHNFSNEEVAQIMGVNYQSACNFIYSALRKLKLNLQVSIGCFLLFLLFL
ncbi:sigma-70 family RNA polymerase sigma factor [Cytophagaceae bacterium YF14B1]|uniref:Sigma-70 family RNA polymerase sigma factor n=1 Tax=Xanthocytophaga flava TaxID=3048013 RepID=A0AAE3U6T8_9BACT|nr:sigma-70 family RNA polymerase sigma factor [Xanthocytophaga flavus]MDJ1480917.1 sigma-70 family RNA polymerase sigma factor [Xanthocytophaga flavus]